MRSLCGEPYHALEGPYQRWFQVPAADLRPTCKSSFAVDSRRPKSHFDFVVLVEREPLTSGR